MPINHKTGTRYGEHIPVDIIHMVIIRMVIGLILQLMYRTQTKIGYSAVLNNLTVWI